MSQSHRLDTLPLSPETRAKLDGMPLPPRAWALAKAAFETAHDRNSAEQVAASAAATVDDPEPPDSTRLPKGLDREETLAAIKRWQDWYDRNEARIDAATAEIRARYPKNLEDLAKAAESNMVDYAEKELQRHFPDRWTAIQVAFEAYREGRLYGQDREKFLAICFNC